jgi:hypothetical protein
VLESPPDPEAIQGAKEWLSHRMPGGADGPTSDQVAFAAVFDTKAARAKAPSFDKLWREAERLIRA